ncbi:uncharacterized protein LOC107793125 [Nicotiana tabacum]|uniref:14.7 kDa ribonuclease H-like protein n=1 Tax=Nicotiana tabacum TaxID=4097 RepID=A0A1S4A2N7_TOBAC|nr:PREDICTED: 14.7 kDa ribonuclease H-like protein [Nicotiana tabacum]
MLENYTPRLKYDKVIGELPIVGWVKVNTDGASRGNPGRSSIGLCIRNNDRDLVYALGREINATTNTEAETVAILEALRICSAHNYMQVWLQTDSLLLKNIVEGLWKPPWCIVEQVEEIWQLLGRDNFKVSHIFREGNKLADHLANYALDV